MSTTMTTEMRSVTLILAVLIMDRNSMVAMTAMTRTSTVITIIT